MKRINILILSLILVIISCQRKENLIGVWVRTGDAFAGLKVEVKKIGNVTNGVIIYCPSSIKKHRV